jgi:hypothetical protein
MDFSMINWLAVAVATLASFALGALWYSLLFKKAWIKGVGMDEAEMKKDVNLGKIFGTCLILTAVMCFGMATLIQGHGMAALFDWKAGLYHGLFIGLCFVAPSTGINYLYQRKSFTLWAIDAGYQVAFLTLMGAILGAWH